MATSLDDLTARARALATTGRRRVLGIAGPPGAGKSTLAEAVVARLDPLAVLVPMDAFHLSNAQLDRLGRRDRKGAPDTFDVDGYVALLRRIKAADDDMYAPTFRRDLDEAIAGSIAIPHDVPLVITEGNYLLVEEPPWASIRDLLDEAWYVDLARSIRIRRLIGRHLRFGKSETDAEVWVRRSDEANAEVVAVTRDRADILVDMGRLRIAL